MLARWQDWDRDERHGRWFMGVVGVGVAIGLAFYGWVLFMSLVLA